MLNIDNLIQIDSEFDEFILEKLKWNIQNYNQYNVKSFYKYTKSLLKFGELAMYNKTRNIKIYKSPEKKFDSETSLERYYAIDNLGLSHSFIFGPKQDTKNSRDIFYGFDTRFSNWGISLDKSFYYYECVNNNNFPDLKLLRDEYLPLKKADEGGVYFNAGNDYDKSHFGPLIYRDGKNCFHLPIVQLLKETLNQTKYFQNIKTELTTEFILFRSREEWSIPGRQCWKVTEGKISYETFQVFDYCILEEESESYK